jgi:hypothetical protein
MVRARGSLSLLLLSLLACSDPKSTTADGNKMSNSGDGDSGDGDTGDGDVGDDDDDDGTGGDDDDYEPPLDCGDTIIRAAPVPVDILIVQDRSSSMIGIPTGTLRWGPSVDALNAVLPEFDDNINLGLLLFPSTGQSCDKGSYSVPLGLNSAAKIKTALEQNPPAMLIDGIAQTPTDLALQQAYDVIEKRQQGDFETAIIPDANVLLVTDGAPGCNLGATEQTRVDASKAVIDKLLKKDVKTYVIGYSIDEAGQVIMNEFANRGGTNQYIPVDSGDSLEKALRDITAASVPCKFKLPGKPSSVSEVTVTIDDQTISLSEEAGWSIDGEVVQLNGESCTGIRDGEDHNVQVNVPCGEIL